MQRLGGYQGEIARRSGALSAAARHQLVFLYACSWNDRGTFWASSTFGSGGGEYSRAWALQFTVERFDQLRLELAASRDPGAAVRDFLASEKAEIAYLPPLYREQLAAYLEQSDEQPGSRAQLEALREGSESTKAEAADRARLDRLLFRLEAVARAYGISATTGEAVRAAVAEPGIFRLAAKRQLVAFVASAQAAGDSDTAELVAQLAPEELRSELEGLASRAAWFHRDITGWVVPNIEK
ncbi:MAG: hypothetical protein MI919_23315, partial [Holophagales bacterium]|nr:hypothetical protein [Holophagales bacterium]